MVPMMTNTNPTPAPKTTIKYETTTCSRCGGTGHYSYCTMHGTTCFACGGRKQYFSKQGAAAHAAVQTFIKEHFSIPAGDVQVGDRVVLNGKTRTVIEIDRSNVACSIAADGTRIPNIGLRVKGCSHYMSYDTKVQLPLIAERFAKVVEFAKTLKGVTIVTE